MRRHDRGSSGFSPHERQPLRIRSAGGVPTRYRRRRKGRGDSPFVAFSRQAGCGSPRNVALAFCLLLGNAKSEDKPGRARQTWSE
ncbi:hypothetical protein [Dysgonomonas sp.]